MVVHYIVLCNYLKDKSNSWYLLLSILFFSLIGRFSISVPTASAAPPIPFKAPQGSEAKEAAEVGLRDEGVQWNKCRMAMTAMEGFLRNGVKNSSHDQTEEWKKEGQCHAIADEMKERFVMAAISKVNVQLINSWGSPESMPTAVLFLSWNSFLLSECNPLIEFCEGEYFRIHFWEQLLLHLQPDIGFERASWAKGSMRTHTHTANNINQGFFSFRRRRQRSATLRDIWSAASVS